MAAISVGPGSRTSTGVPLASTAATSRASRRPNQARVRSARSVRFPRHSSVAVMGEDTMTRSKPSPATRSALVGENTAPSR